MQHFKCTCTLTLGCMHTRELTVSLVTTIANFRLNRSTWRRNTVECNQHQVVKSTRQTHHRRRTRSNLRTRNNRMVSLSMVSQKRTSWLVNRVLQPPWSWFRVRRGPAPPAPWSSPAAFSGAASVPSDWRRSLLQVRTRDVCRHRHGRKISSLSVRLELIVW